MTEIKMTDDEAKAGLNGFNMMDGTYFVLRKIEVQDNMTAITGLRIGKTGRGEVNTIRLQKEVTSFTEAVQEMKRKGY
jgi:hypothetical protein